MGSIPSQGTEVPHAMEGSQKFKKKKKRNREKNALTSKAGHLKYASLKN